ncbi:MAG: DUF6575 domain-containing protein [Nannocystaceae bacterium]
MSAGSLPDLGNRIDATLLGAIEPELTLIDYDGPRLFTANTRLGLRVLASFCDEDDEHVRYFVVPTSESILQELGRGGLTVREALTRTSSGAWLVDVDAKFVPRRVASIACEGVPVGYLPEPGLMMSAELQPLLRVRLEGPELRLASTPRDAFLHAFKSVPEGIKRLLDYMLEQPGTGRPSDELRRFYALPAQQFAFGSLEISYRRPRLAGGDDVATAETLRGLGELLAKCLELVAAPESGSTSPTERRALLEAAKKFAPPTRGAIHQVSFSGAMLQGHTPRRLDRNTRRMVNALLAATTESVRESYFQSEGRVGEIDFDAQTFQLRDIKGLGPRVITVRFEDQFLEDVTDVAQQIVRAIGVTEGDNHWLLAISVIPEPKEGS